MLRRNPPEKRQKHTDAQLKLRLMHASKREAPRYLKHNLLTIFSFKLHRSSIRAFTDVCV